MQGSTSRGRRCGRHGNHRCPRRPPPFEPTAPAVLRSPRWTIQSLLARAIWITEAHGLHGPQEHTHHAHHTHHKHCVHHAYHAHHAHSNAAHRIIEHRTNQTNRQTVSLPCNGLVTQLGFHTATEHVELLARQPTQVSVHMHVDERSRVHGTCTCTCWDCLSVIAHMCGCITSWSTHTTKLGFRTSAGAIDLYVCLLTCTACPFLWQRSASQIVLRHTSCTPAHTTERPDHCRIGIIW